MATTGLPPPPINDDPGSFTWLEWYRQLRSYISTSGSVPWYVINFADSNITDIQKRDHNVLQNLQGGKAGERYHLTAAEYAAISGSGDHNALNNIQGGIANERFHLTENQYNEITLNGPFLPTAGGTMTGPITMLGAQGETGTIQMVPDIGSPGSDVLEVDGQDGIITRSPYLVQDADSIIWTLPGAQVGSMVVVAGIDPYGGAVLGYQAQPLPAYSVQDTHNANVVIKAAGTIPPTAWVELGLEVTLAEDIPIGTGNVMFDMIIQNPTNRTGVLEFGLRVNGVDLARDVTQAIPANFLSTVAISLALVNGYVAGDNIKLIARVTTNNNDGFALNMLANSTDLAVFRMYSTSGSTVVASGVAFQPYLTINSTDVQAAIQELKDELDTLKSQLYAYG